MWRMWAFGFPYPNYLMNRKHPSCRGLTCVPTFLSVAPFLQCDCLGTGAEGASGYVGLSEQDPDSQGQCHCWGPPHHFRPENAVHSLGDKGKANAWCVFKAWREWQFSACSVSYFFFLVNTAIKEPQCRDIVWPMARHQGALLVPRTARSWFSEV